METGLIHALTDNFEAHAQQTEGGVEFWLGRDLQHLLGYTEWRNFTAVISKAKTACEVSGHVISDRFVDVNKTIQMPKNAEKSGCIRLALSFAEPPLFLRKLESLFERGGRMKFTINFLVLVFGLLLLAHTAHAESPREQLKQMVEQLQQTPNDNALREKIIKLAPTLKPSPALPDTAVTFEGRAQFAFRSAKSEDDFLAAAREYEKAVAAAPWVLGYYTDLCTIYEKAGKFEDAKRHCGFYLIGLTDPAQMTDVKRRIAGLEFGIEKAAREKAVAERERSRPSTEGEWSAEQTAVNFQIIKSGEKFSFIPKDVIPIRGIFVTVIEVDQQRVRFNLEQPGYPQFIVRYDMSLSASGNELIGTSTSKSGTFSLRYTRAR